MADFHEPILDPSAYGFGKHAQKSSGSRLPRADCVTRETFEAKIKSLKDCLKTNKSSVNVFVEEDFYQRVKNYLKIRTEQELDIAASIKTPELSKAEINTIKRKKWKYANGKLLTTEGKEVAHQGMLSDILSKCHHRIAHRGRQKTEKWIAENYSEVTQKVVNTFVSLCRFHAEQKPITTRVKPMVSPLQAETFLSLIEVDLMDFRNCPCECEPKHKWTINIIDHHLQISKWCKYTMQASYIMNITYHHAINMTPYEAVFHMKAKRELLDHDLEEGPGKQKRKEIQEAQESYNTKMIKQPEVNPRKKVYKVDDMVSIKIDRVDKKSPFHPNLLLGKVLEIENNYVKVVTPFGRIKGFIAPSRLFPCTATNVKLHYEKEISFTGACKLAENAQ